MNNKNKPKNTLDTIKTYIVIALVVLIGLGIIMSIISATEHYWKEFAISLSITIVLIVVTCPLAYEGDVYECPKCGHKFRVNPYIVFFTNGILRTFDFDGEPMKYAKLKCPHCHTKDWCKRHWKQR